MSQISFKVIRRTAREEKESVNKVIAVLTHNKSTIVKHDIVAKAKHKLLHPIERCNKVISIIVSQDSND